jgi:hypothetical protein
LFIIGSYYKQGSNIDKAGSFAVLIISALGGGGDECILWLITNCLSFPFQDVEALSLFHHGKGAGRHITRQVPRFDCIMHKHKAASYHHFFSILSAAFFKVIKLSPELNLCAPFFSIFCAVIF